MILEAATSDQAHAMARVHAASFETGWSAADIAACLNGPGGFGLIYREPHDDHLAGFLLARAIAAEAEVLTVAVAPQSRRCGLGAALLVAAMDRAMLAGAGAIFLEVAADNLAAIGLYQAHGFQSAGVRRGYYRRPGRAPGDALVLRRDLNRRPA